MVRGPEVRLIGDDGEQLGILKTSDALIAAEDAGLDLVEVAPEAKPPVCRLMDYGKYKYMMSKKATESKKKQTIIHVKEVKFRVKTEEHDIQFKLKNAKRFLSAGDKVKVSVMFRGREITRTELGLNKLKRVIDELKDVSTVEQRPKLEGRFYTMVLAPTASKK
jgi:translation initiation factor IF-3